jgi:enoyl-CoA hydratase/carnithine racemase
MTLFTFRFARSAGADMNEMLQFSPRDAEEFSRTGQEVFAAIERLPMLTVAIIDGDCFGGALDLAMAFDLRFASPRSRFAHPGARLGIVTGFGGTSRWRKIAGRPAANALMIGNRTLSADEARDLGFVDRVADDHEDDLARLESLDPATTRYVKELTRHADKLTRSQLLLLATRLGNLYFR